MIAFAAVSNRDRQQMPVPACAYVGGRKNGWPRQVRRGASCCVSQALPRHRREATGTGPAGLSPFSQSKSKRGQAGPRTAPDGASPRLWWPSHFNMMSFAAVPNRDRQQVPVPAAAYAGGRRNQKGRLLAGLTTTLTRSPGDWHSLPVPVFDTRFAPCTLNLAARPSHFNMIATAAVPHRDRQQVPVPACAYASGRRNQKGRLLAGLTTTLTRSPGDWHSLPVPVFDTRFAPCTLNLTARPSHFNMIASAAVPHRDRQRVPVPACAYAGGRRNQKGRLLAGLTTTWTRSPGDWHSLPVPVFDTRCMHRIRAAWQRGRVTATCWRTPRSQTGTGSKCQSLPVHPPVDWF